MYKLFAHNAVHIAFGKHIEVDIDETIRNASYPILSFDECMVGIMLMKYLGLNGAGIVRSTDLKARIEFIVDNIRSNLARDGVTMDLPSNPIRLRDALRQIIKDDKNRLYSLASSIKSHCDDDHPEVAWILISTHSSIGQDKRAQKIKVSIDEAEFAVFLHLCKRNDHDIEIRQLVDPTRERIKKISEGISDS